MLSKNYYFLKFHNQFLHFVFEGTKTGGLSTEYVCYSLLFLYLIKSVMNTRTRANGLTCPLTITYPAIILRLLSYSIIQRGVQQKCNTETEKLKNFFSVKSQRGARFILRLSKILFLRMAGPAHRTVRAPASARGFPLPPVFHHTDNNRRNYSNQDNTNYYRCYIFRKPSKHILTSCSCLFIFSL